MATSTSGQPGTPTTVAAPSSVPAPGLLRAALDASAEAIVLCATAGDTVLLVNAAARSLVPGLATGRSAAGAPLRGLARATGSGADTFVDDQDGRQVRGRRQRLDEHHYGWYLRDCTEELRRAGALRAELARTAFLAEAGRRLSASLHQRRCLRTTVELAVAHLADAAIVVLPPDRRQLDWLRSASAGEFEEGAFDEQAAAQVPGLAEALDGFPPVPSRWLDPSQAPAWLLPTDFGEVGSLLVVPLPGNAAPAGALVLARRGRSAGFDDHDELLTRVFAARAGAALAAAGLYRDQVDTATVLQADLLPPELVQPDGVELVASYQPAGDTQGVGGDFYDVLPPAGASDQTVIALGDVCGQGPEAAVLTGKVRQTLRALRLVESRPDAMLDVLNQALLHPGGRRHRFVTMVVGTVTRSDHGRVRLLLASGGHPPPLVLRNDGTVEEVPTSGTLIGVVDRTIFRPATVELAPGELCLLFSDGLTEARGGASGTEHYGEQRLHDALASCRGMPGDATVERVRQLVSDWVHGGIRDDIAMLAVRAPSRTPLSLADSGEPPVSPYAIDERRTAGRNRHR